MLLAMAVTHAATNTNIQVSKDADAIVLEETTSSGGLETGAYADQGCMNSAAWRAHEEAKEGGEVKDCRWVMWENTPGSRCTKVDQKGVSAEVACPLACGTCGQAKARHLTEASEEEAGIL